jgi:hypothetical protein
MDLACGIFRNDLDRREGHESFLRVRQTKASVIRKMSIAESPPPQSKNNGRRGLCSRRQSPQCR